MVHARDDIEGLDAAILMHPRVWEASGHVAGFTDPLVDCKQCKNRFRADDPRIKGTPGQPDAQCPVCGSEGHADRAAAVQPHVQDVHGSGRGAGGRRLPAAGDGAGDLRQLPERAAGVAPEGAVRHRADRQGVPQRDHARQLHLPHARVRADGDAVLRQARAPTWSGSSSWKRVADAVAPSSSASRRSGCGGISTARTSWRTTPAPRSTSSTSSRSAGRRSRASTTAATSTSAGTRSTPARSSSTSTRPTNERYVPYIVETSAGADRVTL